MALQLFLVLTCAFLVSVTDAQTSSSAHHYRTVCYIEGWARYLRDPITYHPEDLDTTLCTHVNFAFALVDSSGTQIIPDDPSDPVMYRRLTLLKREMPTLKVMLSVGGWEMGSEEFSAMVSSQQNMDTFAKNAVQFLHQYDFDGIDIDWEYPAARGSPAEDKQRFTKLMQTLRSHFEQDSRQTNKPRMLLSTAISPLPSRVEESYEITEIAKSVDFINLMTYDMHGTWDSGVGHHSPLYSSTKDETDSIDYMVDFIINATVPREKLNLGLPFYGRSFNLTDPTNTNVGAPHSGAGGPGPLVGSPDTMIYSEICKILTENDNVTSDRLPGTNAPFMVDGNRWTGYDDMKSIEEKVQYVMQHGLGGVMIWAIDQDDFHGICGQGHYPLLHTVQNTFAGAPIG